jgi:hypothetical protein
VFQYALLDDTLNGKKENEIYEGGKKTKNGSGGKKVL